MHNQPTAPLPVHPTSYTHSRGVLSTCINLSSAEPASGTTLYFQAIRGGADTCTDQHHGSRAAQHHQQAVDNAAASFMPKAMQLPALHGHAIQLHSIETNAAATLARSEYSLQLIVGWFAEDPTGCAAREQVLLEPSKSRGIVPQHGSHCAA